MQDKYIKKICGNIHSCDSFSTVDGPGIRYVIFMQGCLLRCKYCHNPDTWNVNSGSKYTVDKVLEKILRCKDYMIKSNGGVTITGGEPLLQIDFLTELCKKLKENGIHVTIDTAGSVDITEDLEELLKYVDLVILDLKEMDNEKHIWLTGVENTKIFEFAKYVCNEKKIDCVIRHVNVPGITDSKEEIEKLENFVKTLDSVVKLDYLPYHEMGKYKWKELGIKYEL